MYVPNRLTSTRLRAAPVPLARLPASRGFLLQGRPNVASANSTLSTGSRPAVGGRRGSRASGEALERVAKYQRFLGSETQQPFQLHDGPRRVVSLLEAAQLTLSRLHSKGGVAPSWTRAVSRRTAPMRSPADGEITDGHDRSSVIACERPPPVTARDARSAADSGCAALRQVSGTHKRPRSRQNENLPLSWMMRRPQLLLFFPKAGLFIWVKLTGTVVPWAPA
jgi:hypothetical protein